MNFRTQTIQNIENGRSPSKLDVAERCLTIGDMISVEPIDNAMRKIISDKRTETLTDVGIQDGYYTVSCPRAVKRRYGTS